MRAAVSVAARRCACLFLFRFFLRFVKERDTTDMKFIDSLIEINGNGLILKFPLILENTDLLIISLHVLRCTGFGLCEDEAT